MDINGIEIEFFPESFPMEGRGRIYIGKCMSLVTRDELNEKLIGQVICNKKIIGIESFAVEDQHLRNIGILFEDTITQEQADRFIDEVMKQRQKMYLTTCAKFEDIANIERLVKLKR
jgi:hypothetical protein